MDWQTQPVSGPAPPDAMDIAPGMFPHEAPGNFHIAHQALLRAYVMLRSALAQCPVLAHTTKLESRQLSSPQLSRAHSKSNKTSA
jgi:hypothetical protein